MTQLLDGTMPTNVECVWTFTVTVPEQDIYGIKVAERNVLQFTRADVEEPLQLQIGS